MTFTFFVIDESRFGPEVRTPGSILAVLDQHGAEWGRVEATDADLAAVTRVLDHISGTGPLIATLSQRGSPRHVLLASMEPWRLGYFEAGLIPSLHRVLAAKTARIVPEMQRISEAAELLCYRLTSAVDEARLRGAAVAIRHQV
jgi:hypothetical protein